MGAYSKTGYCQSHGQYSNHTQFKSLTKSIILLLGRAEVSPKLIIHISKSLYLCTMYVCMCVCSVTSSMCSTRKHTHDMLAHCRQSCCLLYIMHTKVLNMNNTKPWLSTKSVFSSSQEQGHNHQRRVVDKLSKNISMCTESYVVKRAH